MEEMRLVAIELDGVLSDLESYVVTRLEVKHGAGVARSFRNLHLRDRYPEGSEIESDYIDILQDCVTYRRLNPDMGAVRLIEESVGRGLFPLIFAQRDSRLSHITTAWVKRVLGDELYAEVGLSFDDKVPFLKRNSDMFEFAVVERGSDCLELNESGITTCVWRQPWNDGVFPSLDTRLDGSIWIQPSDDEEGDYLWNYIGDKNE